MLSSGGRQVQIRGLIDPGSEVSLASAAVIQRLGIAAQEVDVQIKLVPSKDHWTLWYTSLLNKYRPS